MAEPTTLPPGTHRDPEPPAPDRTPAGAGPGAVVTLLVLCLLVVLAAPAWAHTSFASASPGDGETVEAPLDAVRITFDDPLQPDGDHAVGLFGPGDAEVASGDVPEVEPGVIELALPDGLSAAGVHTVRWVVVAADGDEQRGDFTFTASEAAVGPADADTTDEVTTATGTDDAEGTDPDATGDGAEDEADGQGETDGAQADDGDGDATDQDSGDEGADAAARDADDGGLPFVPIAVGAVLVASALALVASRRGAAG